MATFQYFTSPASEPMYSQLGIVEAIRSDNMIFLSGQAGMDDSFQPLPTFEAQCEKTFLNIKKVLNEAGGKDEDIIQIIAYFVDVPTPDEFGQRVMTAFGHFRQILPGCRTTSTAIGVPKLVMPGMMLEVQALAIL
jgi:enamine deaminase RidA (YjgF/YER057c/UK114 family)